MPSPRTPTDFHLQSQERNYTLCYKTTWHTCREAQEICIHCPPKGKISYSIAVREDCCNANRFDMRLSYIRDSKSLTKDSPVNIFTLFVQALENGSMMVKVPEKYWACQGYQLSVPLSCSLWACSEPVQKTGHQAVPDPMLHPGYMMRVRSMNVCKCADWVLRNITFSVGFG